MKDFLASTGRAVVVNCGFSGLAVSGYLDDPALDGGAAVQGAGATHAWAEVYLPGAGWVEYDPTAEMR